MPALSLSGVVVQDPSRCRAGDLSLRDFMVYPIPLNGAHGDVQFGRGTFSVGGEFRLELFDLPESALRVPRELLASEFHYVDDAPDSGVKMQAIERLGLYEGATRVGVIELRKLPPFPESGEPYDFNGMYLFSDSPVVLRAFKWLSGEDAPAWEDASGEILEWDLPGGWIPARGEYDPSSTDFRFLAGAGHGLQWVLVHDWCSGAN